MFSKIGRRSFVAQTLAGTGMLTFSSHLPLHRAKPAKAKLIATTDYYSNILDCQCFFDRARLDELHQYLASIGVVRHQWIFDTIWDLYKEGPEGFDLLSEVVKSAHAHGIELYAIIKLFEGGGFDDTFPNSLPFPPGVNALKDLRGIYPFARPFVAANPHLCLKRRPGTYEVSGPVAAINLVRADDKPTQIRPGNQLTFSRDHTGQYQFNGFQARLWDETGQASAKQHYFELKDGMDVGRAYQLLEGRAIQKEDRWLQLDFNDKDAQGNNRVKEFHSSFGYDLEKVLQDLPIKELRERATAYQLLDRLKQDSREAVSFLQDGKEQRYFIEANPQFKSVNIYDEHSRKITLSAALGNKTAKALKVTHKVNQQQVQAKRNGMKVHHYGTKVRH